MTKKAIAVQYAGINNRKCCSFSIHEILYIFCVTIVCCGAEFVYDIPGSLQVIMMKVYALSNSQYSLFYSLYALPNIFLCFFGGFLIDSALGIRTSTILYMVIALSGSLLFAFGGFIDIFWIMLLGRLFFGLGSEMGSGVCLNYLTFTRFKNSNVNLVFSVSDNFGYMGTMAVYQISYRLYDYFKESYSDKQSLNIVLAITSSLFVISAICGVVMTYLKPGSELNTLPSEEQEPIKEKQKKCQEKRPNIRMTDFMKFPLIFWLLCFTSACFSNAIYTLESFSQGLLTGVYGMKVENASDVTLVLNMTKILFSIPLSMLVDRVGRNTAFVLIAVCTAITSHLFLLLQINPYVCMSLLGLSYAMMGSSIVPMYAYPLSKNHYGLGYGVVTSFSNLSIFSSHLAAGKIIDAFGYQAAEIFYLSGLAIGLVCIIMVWFLDKRSDGILIMTPEERILHELRSLKPGNIENEI